MTILLAAELTTTQIDVLIGFLIAVILGWVIIMYKQSKTGRLQAGIKKSLAKEIHNVKEGEYVRLHGTVQALEELYLAPLSGRKCVGYEILLEASRTREMSPQMKAFAYLPFILDSGTDKAFIMPKSKGVITPQLIADFDKAKEDSDFPKEQIKSMLDSSNSKGSEQALKFEQISFCKEAVVTPGERIAVKGIAHWKVDPKTNKRHLELHGTYDHPILISDDPDTRRILPKNK